MGFRQAAADLGINVSMLRAWTKSAETVGVVARRVEAPAGSSHYLMDHTSTIFILDRHGRIAARIDSHDPVANAVTTIRSVLGSP